MPQHQIDFSKYIHVTETVMEGYPEACNVWFRVGPQSFLITPHGCETREEAEWHVEMLAAALTRFLDEVRPDKLSQN